MRFCKKNTHLRCLRFCVFLHYGGFQLEFVSISQVINRVLLSLIEITAFRLERIFQPMTALEFITGHVVHNPAYN